MDHTWIFKAAAGEWLKHKEGSIGSGRLQKPLRVHSSYMSWGKWTTAMNRNQNSKHPWFSLFFFSKSGLGTAWNLLAGKGRHVKIWRSTMHPLPSPDLAGEGEKGRCESPVSEINSWDGCSAESPSLSLCPWEYSVWVTERNVYQKPRVGNLLNGTKKSTSHVNEIL